jgi:AcrR family transcriptional regulator
MAQRAVRRTRRIRYVPTGTERTPLDRRASTIYLPTGMKGKGIKAKRGRPRAFDADRALDSAMQVFWRKGYLGTSLEDLTEAMDINRPSLYAAFGNKRALYRLALERYFKGPSRYLSEALKEPTARGVIERLFYGVVDMLTKVQSPGTCLWVLGALSCGDDPLRAEFAAQRAAGLSDLRKRFRRAKVDGDLAETVDADLLAHLVQTLNFGLTLQASTGATRKELLGIVEGALCSLPS